MPDPSSQLAAWPAWFAWAPARGVRTLLSRRGPQRVQGFLYRAHRAIDATGMSTAHRALPRDAVARPAHALPASARAERKAACGQWNGLCAWSRGGEAAARGKCAPWRRARPRRRCLGPAETRPSAAELLEDPFFARRHAGAGDARKDRAGTANGGEPSGLADERSLREHADVANEGEACEARAWVGFVGQGGV